MRATFTFAALGALLSTAAAAMMPEPHLWARTPGLEILARQAPGTPEYQCHYDCGFTIAGGRSADYCTNSTWLGLLDSCRHCALKYDIWNDYGKSVTAAAEKCGLDATPYPADDTSSAASSAPAVSTSAPVSSSVVVATTTTTPGQAASSSTVSSAAASSSQAASSATTANGVTSSAATTATTKATAASSAASTLASSAASSSARNGTAATPTPSSSIVPTSGAMTIGYSLSGSLLLVLAGFAAALHM